MAVIDERLLDCASIPEVTENFNRVLAMVDKLAANTECDVVFDSDGGSDVPTQSVKFDTAATEPEDPTKEGFTFIGWFLDDVLFDFDTKIVEDITLTAHWEEAPEPDPDPEPEA